MRHWFVSSIAVLLFAGPAHGQYNYWGSGQFLATNCPSTVKQAPGAYDPNDEVTTVNQYKENVAKLRARLEAAEQRIDRDRLKIAERLPSVIIDGIGAWLVHHPTDGRPPTCKMRDPNVVPPPPGFCDYDNGAKIKKSFADFLLTNGKVDARICVQPVRNKSSNQLRNENDCVDGLNRFYEDSRTYSAIQNQLRLLPRSLADTEAVSGCLTCSAGLSPYASTLGLLSPAYNSLAAVPGLYNYNNAYPFSNLYTAGVPAYYRGYSSIYNGIYGGLPATIGSGAFACQGTNPLISPAVGQQTQLLWLFLSALLQQQQQMRAYLLSGVGPWGYAQVPGGGGGWGGNSLASGMPVPAVRQPPLNSMMVPGGPGYPVAQPLTPVVPSFHANTYVSYYNYSVLGQPPVRPYPYLLPPTSTLGGPPNGAPPIYNPQMGSPYAPLGPAGGQRPPILPASGGSGQPNVLPP